MEENESDILSLKIKNLIEGKKCDNGIKDELISIYNNEDNNDDKNEEEYDDLDNLDINSVKSLYQSVFSVISKSDEDINNKNLNKDDSNNDNNIPLNRNDSNNSIISQASINSSSSDEQKISFWDAIKLKFSDIKNKFIFNYNIFSSSNNLNYTTLKFDKEIQIFQKKYTQHEQLLNELKNIPWFSYRKNFKELKGKDKIYTSDAGWGCMLRASQMIFSQGLCKIYSLDKLSDFINRYLAYFYDNKIPVKFMHKTKNETAKNKSVNEKQNVKIETYDDFEVIDNEREYGFSYIDINSEMINGLENMSERRKNKEYVTPPYSIRSFLKYEKFLNKNGKTAGDWFSNYDAVRLIQAITNDMNNKKDCDFKVINFNEPIVYIEEIIKECFEPYKESSKNEFELISWNNSNGTFLNNTYLFNNKKYILKNQFIMFISVRQGLYALEKEMHQSVLNIFDIETNIGFIGGKKSRAFYFIGKCGNNVIFLDPHYVQDIVPLNKFCTDSVQETYIPKDIFYMNVNELCPSFTIRFAINDMEDFKKLMKKLTSNEFFVDQNSKAKINENKNLLFNVKNFKYPFKNSK